MLPYPGLLESTYEECLCYELSKLSISFTRQTEIPVLYKATIRLDCGYRADIIVEDKVIMEIKSVDGMHPILKPAPDVSQDQPETRWSP